MKTNNILRHYHLNFMQKIAIMAKGKFDAKRGMIRCDNGIIYSPFICKENYICLSYFNSKRFTLIETLKQSLIWQSKYDANIDRVRMYLDTVMNNIDITDNVDLTKLFSIEELNFEEHERNSSKFSKELHMEKLNEQIVIYVEEKKKTKIDIDGEFFKTIAQCEEVYNLMMSKLFIYWSGALKSKKFQTIVTPKFDTNIVLNEMIKNFEILRREYNYE